LFFAIRFSVKQDFTAKINLYAVQPPPSPTSIKQIKIEQYDRFLLTLQGLYGLLEVSEDPDSNIACDRYEKSDRVYRTDEWILSLLSWCASG
jgi:hypothetical protein